jgi:hypothetical protein
MNALDQLLNELADRLASRVLERLRGGEPGMLDQASSPLGRRRHCAAVKRRVGRGEPGAAIVGRRHLLSAEALADELARSSGSSVASDTDGLQAAGSIRTELERELRLVRGGK